MAAAQPRAEKFVEVFRAAAAQAGAVARRLQGEVENVGKEGFSCPEGEALSAADLAAQDVLLLRLAESFGDVAMDAEEDTQSVARFAPPDVAQPLVVVDPIDGSFNYLRGSKDYAVMGAWVEQARFDAVVLYYPAWRVTYWAIAGGGCYRCADGGRTERVHVAELPPRILVPPRTPRRLRERLAEQYEVELSRCSAVDSAAPALGRGLGSVHLGDTDRRRAIGFLAVTEAGGAVLLADGPWQRRDPGVGVGLGAYALADTPARAEQLLALARQ